MNNFTEKQRAALRTEAEVIVATMIADLPSNHRVEELQQRVRRVLAMQPKHIQNPFFMQFVFVNCGAPFARSLRNSAVREKVKGDSLDLWFNDETRWQGKLIGTMKGEDAVAALRQVKRLHDRCSYLFDFQSEPLPTELKITRIRGRDNLQFPQTLKPRVAQKLLVYCVSAMKRRAMQHVFIHADFGSKEDTSVAVIVKSEDGKLITQQVFTGSSAYDKALEAKLRMEGLYSDEMRLPVLKKPKNPQLLEEWKSRVGETVHCRMVFNEGLRLINGFDDLVDKVIMAEVKESEGVPFLKPVDVAFGSKTQRIDRLEYDEAIYLDTLTDKDLRKIRAVRSPRKRIDLED